MEERVSEIKHLVCTYLREDVRISRQRLTLLSQSEPKFILIEGLKLLSLCIEIDSCEQNGCNHNTDNKSVEVILLENKILCPGLPFVVPDGYKLIGSTLILLECFVRNNTANFEVKYSEDLTKLSALKNDLLNIGVKMIPLVDGRVNYYTSLMPEWVCDRLKYLLTTLLEYSQESTALFEESEYARLVESLTNTASRSSGIDSINVLKDCRAQHHQDILSICHEGINNMMTELEIKTLLEKEYNVFHNKLQSGKLEKRIIRTDREKLLREFGDLYEKEGLPPTDDVWELIREGISSSPILRFVYAKFENQESKESIYNQSDTSNCLPLNVIRLLNKIKSLKVFNTRRKFMLMLDTIVLLSYIKHGDNTYPIECWLGNSFLSVNDRLVSLNATKEDLMKWLKRRTAKTAVATENEMTRLNTILHELIGKVMLKISKALKSVNLSFETYFVSPDFYHSVTLEQIEDFKMEGVQPSMYYRKLESTDYSYKLEEFSVDTASDFLMLSSLSLGLINSMKTSSTAKLRQNEVGKNRYDIVHCKESYYQTLKTPKGTFSLLYQKTGEGSKCYSINSSLLGHVSSFYADPKRYFVPIFSHNILSEMITTMMSWIIESGEVTQNLKEINAVLKFIVVLILSHPTKRAQKLLQNLRYFIMAYSSEYHLTSLLDKLKETLITPIEYVLFRLLRCLLRLLLVDTKKTVFSNVFKFILNTSYLCHFITKETPDRLTDQIKCFEKFLEPKIKFGSVNVNSKDVPSEEELLDTITLGEKFLNKSTCKDEKFEFGVPGVSRELFSCMLSAFNQGLLYEQSETLSKFKDPLMVSGCATALDLASNKSVVVNKYEQGQRVLDYNFNKIVSNAVCEISEVFHRKGRHCLLKSDYDYKVQKIISRLVLGGGDKKGSLQKNKRESDAEWSDVSDVFDSQQSDYYQRIKDAVDDVVSRYGLDASNQATKEVKPCLSDLFKANIDKLQYQLILSEITRHPVEEFDFTLFDDHFYQNICTSLYSDNEISSKYFLRESSSLVSIKDMSKALCKKFLDDEQYFSCFKLILLQMHADKMVGRFSHYKRKTINYKFDMEEFQKGVRLSERESNSEAISKALSLNNFTSSALKNLCFYSEESPQSYNSVSPDTGRLKFALSYKEQVGGNRELYIGDLRTKMFTRLIEDYFEAFTNQFKGSCLNNEKEFENAIISMKLNVSLANLSYSMDHSKWGPMMCPLLFIACLQNIKLAPSMGLDCNSSKEYITTLLSWHIHKIVEIPFNVVNAMMKSYLKRGLGLMKNSSITETEAFFFSSFDSNIIPSHISSVLDMGQGILHNTSDFYGLISERFINYCLRLIFPDTIESYTSSDDQITLFGPSISKLAEDEDELVEVILNFHYYLSDQLNKFVSPKSSIGRFVAEFKSRFFVWGEEVPLLTKFVAASLHNIKCKEPHQLSETIDTIIDQCVANGVPLKLCNLIQLRVIRLLEYSQYPIDPFLLNVHSDAKDWVDGNRGYRIMRNIERIDPEGTKLIRSIMRKLYNQLKQGKLHEEFTASFLSGDIYQNLYKICSMFGVEVGNTDLFSIGWLNLSACMPLRMVLRQKVLYPGIVNVEDEKLPTIVKTLQSKLSQHFTKGAQKLLSESINRSAFQSSIASGFVGLCKTIGSKCVRDSDRGTHYIKSVLNCLKKVEGVVPLTIEGMQVWKLNTDLKSIDDCWVVQLLRPILWDYFCIGLSTALEIGPWVLGEPKIKTVSKVIKFRCCDYFPTRPSSTRILEDRVNYNHIIHSIRRLYPDVFEKYLLPFMSDLAATKMKWSPRIKFLDLCVVLDVNCEALSLVSHVVKWKREELYTVLSSDLAVMHERQNTTLVDQRVVCSEDICKNFLKQLFFESYLRSFVATSRTLGSFSWFPHRTSLPESEGLKMLGPFATFVEKVIYKGIERPMYRYDLFMGFSHLTYVIENPVFNLSQLIASGLTETGVYESLGAFWDALKGLKPGSIEILVTIRFRIKSQGESYAQTFNLILSFRGSIAEGNRFIPSSLGVQYSGQTDDKYLMDCWNLVKADETLKIGEAHWFISMSNVSDYFVERVDGDSVLVCKVVLTKELMSVLKEDMVRVGPEWEYEPIVVRQGSLWEGEHRMIDIVVDINDDDFRVFMDELLDDHFDIFIKSLHNIIKDRLRSKRSFESLDMLGVLSSKDGVDAIGIINQCFQGIEGWCEFKTHKLCYSNSLGKVMVACSNGSKRLRGVQCEELGWSPGVEDID
ncbi:L [Mammarenavirus merinoense]|uniref:RNA-directed RNA polymerase L n=1 Tax=Mammarenavirus merinoense TaxID=3052319 RepID=D4N7Z9_9VIRU|nr:L [Mammarenavirus merinoense] [Mammarenavirus merinoense]ADD63340.1 L [Mammarenavirus merinoense] [Mammarenavirus merinoense]